ncbi:MAG: carboxy terminal-processing peptidase [Porticoccaceae bacterium]|jgi:carboxyl-terminal processing protease|nr:carboxy terminal-processing peptidase [Porticoccaceae bacterium]
MKLPLLSCLLLALLPLSTLGAASQTLDATPEQVETTLEILDKLGSKHYLTQPVDDKLSRQFLDNYLESLDPSRGYLLQSDVEGFQKQWATSLDDLVKQGELSPGFTIFKRYRDRVITQLEENIALLEPEQPFDLTVDETLVIDPDNKTWVATEAEMDDMWRKKVKDSYIRLLLADKEPEAARELLVKRYKNQIKRIKEMDAEDVYQLYMNALTTLYDPHTTYFSPRQLENFNISMSLSLEGIGAVLQVDEENTKVVRIVPGGPADKQGELAPQDVIVGVGQDDEDIQDVVGWRLDDVVDQIRGPKGTTVRLEVIPAKGERAGQHHVISIVRDEVKLEEQAAKSRVIELHGEDRQYRIGVIDIPAFYIDFEAFNKRDPNFKSTTRDVALLLEKLRAENVDGIVIDLRNNGGGSLHEATTLTDLFINPGPVVQIRYANQMISRQHRSRKAPVYDGPLMVLINRLSASASEIFAGAIQDYGRGLVVGTQSFGKGTVQTLLPLPEGQLKLTESKFYRVSGESTQHRGIVPDIAFPSLYNLDEIGESSEKFALPWDKIHGIPVNRHPNIAPLLPRLKARHQERAAADPDFNFLLDELAYRERLMATREVSLNLERRRQELKDNELALLDMENKRRLAKGEEVYASLEDWKKDNPEEDEDAEPVEETADTEIPLEDDPLLKEAGMILVDGIVLGAKAPAMVVEAGQAQ